MASIPSPVDAFAGVLAKLVGDGGFAAAFPGKGWFQKWDGVQPKLYPFLVGTVEPGDPTDWDSGGNYQQIFLVTLTAWTQSGASAAADANAPLAYLNGLLDGGPGNAFAGITVANAVGVLWCRAAGGSLKLTADLRRSQDLLAGGKRISLCIQGKAGTG